MVPEYPCRSMTHTYFAVNGELDCSVTPDGHYNIGCKTYEVCDGGVYSTVECLEHMVYNNVTKQCDELVWLYYNHYKPQHHHHHPPPPTLLVIQWTQPVQCPVLL